ncbi:hypothetical protein EYY60_11330 [Flavobacterium zhairuonense]|uniref:beta strand repeat-containing protein n=1 Tax=Flavobacterium zhairuonense TaxID=2493631 RepID=UPI001050C743|nr:hypothetical protein [Flavobacterium zhairuonense]KAF2510097.1 hypothetical protein EYY60_11330 [Flavobacterium zhairuonense]
MKKITCLLLLIQSGFMMAQTKTVVTQNGEKVTIHPNANNGITANAGYIQLGGDLKQATTLKTTSAYTLALDGLLAGANSDAVLVIDSNNIIRYVSRTEFAGDNLGNHTATQDLNMNTKNITGAANITATGKTSTATAQITTGATAGYIATSVDAAGNVVWTDPATITTKGDNLGNHIATQDLNMNAKNIAGAANITATGKTSTSTAQITTGAGDGKIAVSDSTGNVTWTDPETITTKGDNLGNHIATQDLNMNTKNIAGAANITATGKTSTATAQITTGATAGYIATSVDAAGNVVWTDPATITTKGDNLGNHIATQDLNMNAKNIAGAANITATGKTSTSTAQITTGAGDGKIAVSDSTGNVTWTDPATITTKGDNLGNHIATQDLNMNTKNITGAANITATGKTSTATAQITTGATAGYIATSVDATGNVVWTDPATIATKGDNLGNHIATQDLNMNTKNITGAANITATGKTSTATAQITTGAAVGYVATSVDAVGNVVWTDPATFETQLAIDEFTTASAGIDSFTLNATPKASKVQMYVNGVVISKDAISVTGTTVKYLPASNGSYTLMANDLIKFTYLK